MAGINIGATQAYYNPQSGITGTDAQHAEAIRKKRESEQQSQQQQQFQTQQTQQSQNAGNVAASGYTSGAPSAQAAGTATRNAASTSSLTGAGYAVDPSGYTSFNDSAAQTRQTNQQTADLQAAADARKLQTLQGLMAQYGGAGRDAAPSLVQHRGIGVNGDEEAARAAAFGRAKDQSGEINRGALDTLRSLYAGSGNVGAQRQGMENIVASGARDLNEFTRDQLMADLQREGEVSDMMYQGGITQRGQDINRPFNPQLQALISLMGTIY